MDAKSGFYKVKKYEIGNYFGPVDLGLHLSTKYNSLNIGTGLFAGSIFPGSNRLIFTGFSPCWGGFYISSMGGAGLVFDNLGINMLSISGKASQSSILFINRFHGEELDIDLIPVDVKKIWFEDGRGLYALIDYVKDHFSDRYENDPRILATGPAALYTDIGAIGSIPINSGKLTYADTWAGRGGMGSKLLQDHNIVAIIYGGTYIDEDFRDRKVADKWFYEKYEKKLAAKDIEATTKYRFEPKFETGGTFGVNYATIGTRLLSFNYQSIYWSEDVRQEIHKKLIINHYLKQFNEETIIPKQQTNCGEPCAAVCKKLNGHFKKDYEPYQVFGPLSGIFDQRAAEQVNFRADSYGMDAISAGGTVAWIMECLSRDLLDTKEIGITNKPIFDYKNFNAVEDSTHNAQVAMDILDSIIYKRGIIDLSQGARKWGRHISRQKGKNLLNYFVFNSFGRNGWIVPNQYWTPGALSPMAIMGKYYMYYGSDFLPPRELGKINAHRFKQELIMDNAGFCRFHRIWSEEMIPEMIGSLWGKQQKYIDSINLTASKINSRNASIFWESERNIDFVFEFLKYTKKHSDDFTDDLDFWINEFKNNKFDAALNFWYEIHKGTHESLREFY
ncbi:MAG: aldehyde ferredoxin oxidoreductase N-terminal domain-containing protein [Candidatus Cloacimonetes bacterium]|nr:aldehyde ferredoxin oxidoreductase N-terminal domain-containing protein [Candidatus Cloacimonadota bacterium]